MVAFRCCIIFPKDWNHVLFLPFFLFLNHSLSGDFLFLYYFSACAHHSNSLVSEASCVCLCCSAICNIAACCELNSYKAISDTLTCILLTWAGLSSEVLGRIFKIHMCFFPPPVFAQCAKTFLNLMAHISKEQTVQYILTLIDDTLQVHRQNHWLWANGICIYKPYTCM